MNKDIQYLTLTIYYEKDSGAPELRGLLFSSDFN